MKGEIGEQTNSEQDRYFENKKTEFFVKTGLSVREAFKMHKEAGLWGEGEEDWRNVSEHCLVESARVSVLAEKLGLSEDIKKDLILSAALHDFFKKEEIKSYEMEGMSWINYKKAEDKASELLKKKGFNDRIIRLVGSIGGISLAETESILKKDNLSQEDIAFLVLHYVDDYTSGSDWVQPSEITGDKKIINSLDRRVSACVDRYSLLNEEGKSVFNGESTYSVQLRVGHEVERRIASILNAKNNSDMIPEDLPYLIDQEIRAKIESQ